MLPKTSMTENDNVLDCDLSLKNTNFLHYIPVQVTAVVNMSDNFIQFYSIAWAFYMSAVYSDTVDISSQFKNNAIPQTVTTSYFQ